MLLAESSLQLNPGEMVVPEPAFTAELSIGIVPVDVQLRTNKLVLPELTFSEQR